jgi:hypothetical protein
MHLITAHEFLASFPEKRSVVFVGNAPSLNDENLGGWIDSHDVVVRFNECPLAGYENDVGTRTDIVVTNPYPEGRRQMTLSAQGVVLMISPQTRRESSAELEGWLNSNKVLFTFSPDIVGVGNIDHKSGLTTGVYGIQLLSRLLSPSKMSVTGFTLFLANTSRHYWQSAAPKGLHAHDVVTEAGIFIRICNSVRCQLEVTEDISWVANQIGEQLREGVMIRNLLSNKWRS